MRLILIALFVVATVPTSQAQTGRRHVPDPTAGYGTIESNLTSHGWAPVVVKLDVPGYQPEGRLRGRADRANQRSRISAAQDALLGGLDSRFVRVKRRFKLLPYVALEVTRAGLQLLESNPNASLITIDAVGETSALSGSMSLSEMASLIPPPTAESHLIVGADVANANGCDGEGWAIAILDSGIQSDHPSLAGRVTHEACFSTQSPALNQESLCPNFATDTTGTGTGDDCTPCRNRSGTAGNYTYSPADCDFWPPVQVACPHGTLITGTAAGDGSLGVYGIAPEVEVISIRVMTRYFDTCPNPPWDLGCPLANASDVMAAVEHVAELSETVKIAALNMSLDMSGNPGSPGWQTEPCDNVAYLAGLKDAIDLTNSYGIPATAATGNNDQRDRISPPACLSNVISVGYTQDGSSYYQDGLQTTVADAIGHEPNRAYFLDFWAPGEWITSGWPHDPLETTRTTRGTSLAAPQVAAAFAALRSKGGARGIDYYRTLLDSTGLMITDNKISDPPKPGEPTGITKPRIDVGAACLALSAVELDAKVLLEGPYAGGGMMSPGAELLTDLPTAQPFGDPEYSGTTLEYSSVDAVPAVPDGVLDWVMLELRSGTGPGTTVARRPALLLADGTIADYDGTSPVGFLGVDSTSYYVVVRHRNHGDVMSSSPIDFSSGSGSWDFTTGMSQAYSAGADPMKTVDSRSMMFAGDISLDDQINAADFNEWLVQTKQGVTGYWSGDLDLDGHVTVNDFNFWLANTKSSLASQVP